MESAPAETTAGVLATASAELAAATRNLLPILANAPEWAAGPTAPAKLATSAV